MANPWGITPDHVDAVAWPDAAHLAPTSAQARLDAAQVAAEAYAPPLDLTGLTVPDQLPAGYVLAVTYLARDIHNAGRRVGDAELVGDAAYPIRVRPLSSAVKALLRPQAGRPAIG